MGKALANPKHGAIGNEIGKRAFIYLLPTISVSCIRRQQLDSTVCRLGSKQIFVRLIRRFSLLAFEKMVIRVFIASSSASVAIKKRQQEVVGFLESNRIEFEEIDITMLEDQRRWMYHNIPQEKQPAKGNPLPPQIFNNDAYCGDYDAFFESKENNTVSTFFGLKPKSTSRDSEP
ncbi:SH3 domain-binding glutamic acid-rich-like protein 2 isoform X1 [Cetorhinus maximus]